MAGLDALPIGGFDMALTTWINGITGERLDAAQLGRLRDCAHRLYEANVHIFEDEREALSALGAVSMFEAGALAPLAPAAA
jgi:hypothetical protein